MHERRAQRWSQASTPARTARGAREWAQERHATHASRADAQEPAPTGDKPEQTQLSDEELLDFEPNTAEPEQGTQQPPGDKERARGERGGEEGPPAEETAPPTEARATDAGEGSKKKKRTRTHSKK